MKSKILLKNGKYFFMYFISFQYEFIIYVTTNDKTIFL